MSDKEIRHFFRNRPAKLCGRFQPDQFKHYSSTPKPSGKISGQKWLQAGFLSLLLVFLTKQSPAIAASKRSITEVVHFQDRQDEKESTVNAKHIIKGTVSDESGEPLPGITIYLKGTSTGTISDINGNFKFPVELQEGDVLVFCYIGFRTQEFRVPKNTTEAVEISMVMFIEEVVLMGEAWLMRFIPQNHRVSGVFGKN